MSYEVFFGPNRDTKNQAAIEAIAGQIDHGCKFTFTAEFSHSEDWRQFIEKLS